MLVADLQSAAHIKAICNRHANYKFAEYTLRIAIAHHARCGFAIRNGYLADCNLNIGYGLQIRIQRGSFFMYNVL